MNVFIAIPVGIGHKTPIGVFPTEKDALEAANDSWKHSDGYHGFEIHEMQVGVAYDYSSRVSGLNWNKPYTTKPLQVVRLPESDHERVDF